jgi:hypothetical protein
MYIFNDQPLYIYMEFQHWCIAYMQMYWNCCTISNNLTNRQWTHCHNILVSHTESFSSNETLHLSRVALCLRCDVGTTLEIAFLFYLFLQYLTLPKADFNKSLNLHVSIVFLMTHKQHRRNKINSLSLNKNIECKNVLFIWWIQAEQLVRMILIVGYWQQVSACATFSSGAGRPSAVLTALLGQRLQVLSCQSVVLSQDVAFSLKHLEEKLGVNYSDVCITVQFKTSWYS